MFQFHLWHLKVLLCSVAVYLGTWKIAQQIDGGGLTGLILFLTCVVAFFYVGILLGCACICIHDRSWRAIEPTTVMDVTAIGFAILGGMSLACVLLIGAVTVTQTEGIFCGLICIGLVVIAAVIVINGLRRFFGWLFENY